VTVEPVANVSRAATEPTADAQTVAAAAGFRVESPRIDAHHHVWDLRVRDQPWTRGLAPLRRSFAMADLRPALRAHRIAGTVVVQTVDLPEETPELLTLAAHDPDVAGVVGWVDLRAPDVADRLAALRSLDGGDRLVGIRHQVQSEPDPGFLDRAAVRRGLAAVAAAGLCYDMVVTPSQLPAVARAVGELPQLRFVLDHGGKPAIRAGEIEPWRRDISRIAAAPNVAAKLSGLITEADPLAWTIPDVARYGRVLVDEFGPGRLMFGSDWPVCLLRAGYRDVLVSAEAALQDCSDAERDQVFGGTAAAWYRLAPR